MKKALALLLAVLTVFAFVSCGGDDEAASASTTSSTTASTSSAPAQKTVTLILSEVHAEGYPTTLADYEFARLVEERTEGRVKINVYSGGTLYGEETGSIEALQIGDLDFARVSASPVASYVPALNVIQLPYLYRDGDHMWQVLNGPIGQEMLNEIESSGSGLIGLCYYDAGARNFYTTTPVQSVADMAGLKIRLQNNAMMVEMVQLLGGNGVTGIGPNEVYSAISQGTIDGAENNWPTYESMGDYEAAPYFILDGHTRVPEILLASANVVNKVSAEDWEIIKECAKDTQEYEIEQWALREESSREKVVAAGVTVYEPTAEELAEFQAKMDPIYAEYGAGYEDMIEEILNTGL